MEEELKLTSFRIKRNLYQRVRVFLATRTEPETMTSFINDAIEMLLEKRENE